MGNERPTFRIAQSLDDLLKAFIVRGIVFMGEQHVSYALEKDEHEHAAVHILGETGEEPVAAGRIRFLGEHARLERLAVREEWRGLGHGSRLLGFMMDVARSRGFAKFKLNAQVTSKVFYLKHGFRVVGETFMEAGMEHCLMLRED